MDMEMEMDVDLGVYSIFIIDKSTWTECEVQDQYDEDDEDDVVKNYHSSNGSGYADGKKSSTNDVINGSGFALGFGEGDGSGW
jgi:hypothetical protein